MCGDSHLPSAPESSDLVAIIHPVSEAYPLAQSPAPLSRTNSASSSLSTSTSSSSCILQAPRSIHGRLHLSNSNPNNTTSQFSHDHSDLVGLPGIRFRIHKYGIPLQFGDGNPVVHEFRMGQAGITQNLSGPRLDLGVGGNGIIGRTISIVDWEDKVLGEGIVGRM